MKKAMIKLTAEEINASIPYSMICMTRYGSRWDTGRRRRAWISDFSDSERKKSSRLFRIAHRWTVIEGVPSVVRMDVSTYYLWRKLGKFCASI